MRFEIKFLLGDSQIERVLAWAREHLEADPYADSPQQGTYQVTSLYLDTEERHVYHRRPEYKHSKYRVRRYGYQPFVFLERKSRWRNQVEKRRTKIIASTLISAESGALVGEQGVSWFRRRILALRLEPAFQLTYTRAAYVGMTDAMRLTLDRQIRCCRAISWTRVESRTLPVLAGGAILELKYENLLPRMFDDLLGGRALTCRPISKYRLAVQACEQVCSSTDLSGADADHTVSGVTTTSSRTGDWFLAAFRAQPHPYL